MAVLSATLVHTGDDGGTRIKVFRVPAFAAAATDEWIETGFDTILGVVGCCGLGTLGFLSDFNFLKNARGTGVVASGLLTFAGQPLDNETVTIDGRVYTFQTGAVAAAYDVLIGALAADTRDNLAFAINRDGGGGEGTNFGTGTVAHPRVRAFPNAANMDVFARLGGAGGNSITTVEAATNLSFGGGTLAGGSGAQEDANPGALGIESVAAGAMFVTVVGRD